MSDIFRFFKKLDEIFSPEYIPSVQDVLLCRVKTTGISESFFKIGKLNYRYSSSLFKIVILIIVSFPCVVC